MPVGLMADATYESDHFQLHAGDRLVLVTDGVTEAENAQGEFFDNHRLEEVAANPEACRTNSGCSLRFLRRHAAQRRLHGCRTELHRQDEIYCIYRCLDCVFFPPP